MLTTIDNLNIYVNNIPKMQFSLECPEIIGRNRIYYHSLSMYGNSDMKHCRILINMPY